MNSRTAWAGCAAAGSLAFLCSWLFGRIPGLVACGPTGGLGPIIAFELVRTPADVAALFGSAPCRSTLAAAQRSALWLDGLGFIPAYSAFLILAVGALATRGVRKWALIAVLAAAGLLDEIEGHLLGRILDALPGGQGQIDMLYWVVRVKFVLLALGTAGIGMALLATRRRSGMVAGLAVGTGAATAGAGFLAGPLPLMMTGFAIGWVSLLLAALAGAWRPALFSPAAS